MPLPEVTTAGNSGDAVAMELLTGPRDREAGSEVLTEKEENSYGQRVDLDAATRAHPVQGVAERDHEVWGAVHSFVDQSFQAALAAGEYRQAREEAKKLAPINRTSF